jgi:hypothetical protein
LWEYAPHTGWLWTPGYWGWSDGVCVWHSGYWGRHVGFYGGVDYGYGYSGVGYGGGYWKDNEFFYNRSVTKVNVTVVTNTYQAPPLEKTVTVTPVSYNGGNGGIASTPTNEELAAAHEQHVAATPMQRRHVQAASINRELLASQNHGIPRTELLAKRLVPVPAKVIKVVQKPKPKKKPKTEKEEQPKRTEQIK